MYFKGIGDLRRGFSFHVESHRMKPCRDMISAIAQRLLTELDQLLNFLLSPMDFNGTHEASSHWMP